MFRMKLSSFGKDKGTLRFKSNDMQFNYRISNYTAARVLAVLAEHFPDDLEPIKRGRPTKPRNTEANPKTKYQEGLGQFKNPWPWDKEEQK